MAQAVESEPQATGPPDPLDATPAGELGARAEAGPAQRTGTGASPSAVAAPVRLTLVLVAVAIGALERLWVATHTLGTLTSDGSVVGLMALHLLHHGQLTTYFWGQAYGGSLEPIFTAGVFGVAGEGTSQLLAASALSSALAALALWRAGRHIVGEPAAALGALAFWVWPATVMLRSLKPGGTYMIGLTLTLWAVGALARLHHGDDRWTVRGLAGLWCGLAFWSSSLCLQLLVPALIWCGPTMWRLGRRMGVVLLGAVVGAAPAIVYGVAHNWSNLRYPDGDHAVLVGFTTRLAQFFRVELPIMLNLRVEGSLAWVSEALGLVLLVVALAALVALAYVVARGRAKRCRLPLLTLVLLPILYTLNPLTSHVGQGRYALFGLSMATLLVGVGVERAAGAVATRWPTLHLEVGWVAGLALLAAMGILAMGKEPGSVIVGFSAPDVPMHADDAGLQALVRLHDVRDAYANYWIAYRLTFESDEATIATPLSDDRYPPYPRVVASSADPAYLFISTSASVGRFEQWCQDNAITVKTWSSGGFTVVQPTSKVLPREVASGVLSEDGQDSPSARAGPLAAGRSQGSRS